MTLNLELEREYVRPVRPSAPGRQHIIGHLDIPVDDLRYRSTPLDRRHLESALR